MSHPVRRYQCVPASFTRRQFGAILTGAAFGTLMPKAARGADAPWTVAIVPDPQYLAAYNTSCGLYDRLIQWAVDNRNLVVHGAPLNVKGFIQLGDCQDTATATYANDQETVAVNAWASAMKANLFVAWCCGNHDYENGGNAIDRRRIGHAWRTDTNGAWSPENLAANYGSGLDLGGGDVAFWGGVYDDKNAPRSSANNFIRLQVGSRKILIIALEFFARSEVLNWAKSLHDTYSDHEVWVTTHGYMATDGSRCPRVSTFGPASYALGDAPGSNSGEQMWDGSDASWAGLKQWPRLGLVTCGHWVDGYSQGWVWQKRQDTGTAGQSTVQLFCNTQMADFGVNVCSGATPQPKYDVAHLMLLRVWPGYCESFLVSTNSGLWTGARGVRNASSPIQLFWAPLGSAVAGKAAVSIDSVLGSADGRASIETGSWATIYGKNLSQTQRTWDKGDFVGDVLPTAIDGVRVTIDGKPAAVSYVSPTQLNVQVPADASVGNVAVTVSNGYGSASGTAMLQVYAPAFFPFGHRYVAGAHMDDVYIAPRGFFGPGTNSRPAVPGETLVLFGTGFGPTSPAVMPGQMVAKAAWLTEPAQLQIYIGGVLAKVEYAGLVVPGEYQFNVIAPNLPDGDQPITAVIAGVSTQPGMYIPYGK